MSVRMTFLGSGDAFGSGGRMNACFLVKADSTRFLIDYGTLTARIDDIAPKRFVITHMSAEMLARLDSLDCEFADDGKTIEL